MAMTTKIAEAIAILENADNYLDDGFENAIETLIHAAQQSQGVEDVVVVAQELITFVMQRYGVEDADGFICPIHRRLYQALAEYRKGGGE
jgi:hypothetical protein